MADPAHPRNPDADNPSVNQLIDDIWTTLRRHRMESRLNYAEVIGALECIKAKVFTEMNDLEQGLTDDPPDDPEATT